MSRRNIFAVLVAGVLALGLATVAAPATAAADKPLPAKYSFMHPTSDGSPIRWRPCVPLTWAMASKDARPAELARLRAAFAAVTKATGIRFTYEGIRPAESFSSSGMATIDGVDISVSFKRTPSNPRGLAGLGGSAYWTSSDERPWASQGQAWFDDYYMDTMSGAQKMTVYLHELGHVMGLDHTRGHNIMTPADYSVHRYSKGDLAGLRLLGVQPGDCDPGGPGWAVDPDAPAVNSLAVTWNPDGSLAISWVPARAGGEWTLYLYSDTDWEGADINVPSGAGSTVTIPAETMAGLLPGERLTISIDRVSQGGSAQEFTSTR